MWVPQKLVHKSSNAFRKCQRERENLMVLRPHLSKKKQHTTKYNNNKTTKQTRKQSQVEREREGGGECAFYRQKLCMQHSILSLFFQLQSPG